MFETLKRLYNQGELSMAGLDRAVVKKWITQEQKNQIISMA